MKNDNTLLLKTLLLSTSLPNTYRYTKDKKKKNRVIAAYIGFVIIYAMLIGYSLLSCIGYGKIGMTDVIPLLNALAISALAFVFTFFKTNGYLFNFKEYDMLMSLPFKSSTVAACKFLYMYIKSLPWYLCISFSMMVGYGYFKNPDVIVYPIWFFLTFLIPFIPMLLASFLGFIIARLSSGFKKKNTIQTVLTLIFILFCFSIQYIIQGIVENDAAVQTLSYISDALNNVAKYYPPAGWFASAVTVLSISDILLFTGVTLILFSLVFYIVGRSYRNINSALKSHASAKNYKMTAQKHHSVLNAIAFKEFKRLTGSTVYMTNGMIGYFLVAIISILSLVIGFDKLIHIITKGAPFDYSVVTPAIPFFVYFFTGMMATTACSFSLEGKNYWIVQSLPISRKTLAKGKMLFNMYLSVPVTLFGILCLSISAKVPLSEMISYLLLGISLCAFSTTWGCVCGIKHMRLDWENEVEVIKQGAAVSIYLLPNMFATMLLITGAIALGMKLDHRIIALIMICVSSMLAALSYLKAMALSKENM